MKILFLSDTQGGPFYQRKGLANAFNKIGHISAFWSPEAKPAFDVFSEFEPDIFFGQTYTLTRAICKCIQTRPDMKVALFAGCYGDVLKDIDIKKYPLMTPSINELKRIETFKKETGKPDFVWIHHHPNTVNYTLGYWKEKLGIEYIGSAKAADTVEYKQGRVRSEFECDLAFVGGYWPYKAVNLDKYLIPLCHPDVRLNIKIFGNNPNWPVPNYLGFLPEQDVSDLFASAQICPNIYEPHSIDFGFDVIERPLKVLWAGGFVLDAGYVSSMHNDYFPTKEIPYGKTHQEFFEKIDFFLKHPEQRQEFVIKGRKRVAAEHTYFHRIQDMFIKFGLDDEAIKCLI